MPESEDNKRPLGGSAGSEVWKYEDLKEYLVSGKKRNRKEEALLKDLESREKYFRAYYKGIGEKEDYFKGKLLIVEGSKYLLPNIEFCVDTFLDYQNSKREKLDKDIALLSMNYTNSFLRHYHVERMLKAVDEGCLDFNKLSYEKRECCSDLSCLYYEKNKNGNIEYKNWEKRTYGLDKDLNLMIFYRSEKFIPCIERRGKEGNEVWHLNSVPNKDSAREMVRQWDIMKRERECDKVLKNSESVKKAGKSR